MTKTTNEIALNTPCTLTIGSDSYGYRVTRIVGVARVEITRVRGGEIVGGPRVAVRCQGGWRIKGSRHEWITFGEAVDHRDEAF